MSDAFRKRPCFTKEKADLLKRTLAQFDDETPGDLLSSEESTDATSIKDRTFLLHVLIETLCYILEKEDEDKRKKLFNKIYKNFENKELVNSKIDVDNLAQIRKHVALRFYEHIKQVHRSLGPLSIKFTYDEEESCIPISRIEKYNEAFDELQVIARGGFGVVCKARHKVDGGTYAVKKIVFEYRSDSDYVKVMREVRNLSSLSNKYVVAYNNAWVQPVDEPCDLNSADLDSESDYTDDEFTDNRVTYDQSTDFTDATFSTHLYSTQKVSSYNESSSIVFQDDSSDSKANSIINRSKSFIANNSSKNEDSPPKCPMFRIKMMLCIQMEFCDYDLRHWIDARNDDRPLPFVKSIQDIFKEILSGVAYIHEKQIIHRDLKPQNIFFSEDKGVMKVGDFGLATLCHTPSDEEPGSSKHSTNLGTLPYAAPEQRSNTVYDSKVDVYSLGIILIELLVKIQTKMEFFKIIDKFKQGDIPGEIKQKWPEYIPLLKNVLQEDHTYRKEAKEILDMPLFKEKNIEGSDLEQKVKDLERELANKEQEFQEQKLAMEQEFQEQKLAMEQEFQEQKLAMEQEFQEQKREIEAALVNKERLFEQILGEVKLLKEQVKSLK